jgi:hypothetical protein
VTIAQRARLVVVLGILNLVLASLALAVGAFGIPSGRPQPSIDTAAGSPSPSSTPTESTPSTTQTPPAPPATNEPPASAEPSATPTASTVPSASAVPVQSQPPLIARPNSPTPDPTARPDPTPRPAPPTPQPPEPTPPPQPVADGKLYPPCPGSVDVPPGKAKGQGHDQPCGKGQGSQGRDSGVVIVLPLAAIGSWVASHWRRPTRSRGSSQRG